jgi:cyclopropane fatty-acyl-phospholipid synthase-like methyltransferase
VGGAPEVPDWDGPVEHRFERAEDWVPVFDAPDRDGWQKPAEVVALLEIEPGMTVVDLGAGTGYFLHYLSRAVGATGKVIALDVEPDMIRYMRERAAREGLENVDARIVPYDDPALAEGSVDRVLVVDTWHHISNRSAYARRLADALARDGMVTIVDFTIESRRGPPRSERLLSEAVVRELAGSGLSAKILAEALPDQYVVSARVAERPRP